MVGLLNWPPGLRRIVSVMHGGGLSNSAGTAFMGSRDERGNDPKTIAMDHLFTDWRQLDLAHVWRQAGPGEPSPRAFC
jgi:hypothetical protein